MSGAVRARFAPSPTGSLHVGSARTALLNWLFVHSPEAGPGARLLLRIDDTDRERSDPALEATVLDDLRWLGLAWDDGPVRQSERGARYAEALAELPVTTRDGAGVFGGRVIARADGSALYNLATAVDDVDDGITHVLRGRDHQANTEFQREIIRALGAEPPVYVHAPLMTLPAGGKISKRDGVAGDGDPPGGAGEAGSAGAPSAPPTLARLREDGYPPAAVCNALALSLADFGTEELMLTLEDQARRFSLDRLHTADSRFDVDKLNWISGLHIRELPDDAFAGEIVARIGAAGSGVAKPALDAALAAARTGGDTLGECAATAGFLLDPPSPDAHARELAATAEAVAARELLNELMPAPPTDPDAARELFGLLKAALRDRDVPLGPALHGLRATLTGRTEGPEFPYVLATITPQRLAQLRDGA
ncbi:MAG: hypothetical protein HY827_06720 [Actinobacteria bacterium]|nr:hypothetical protein [Actinomycetota bacterium]